MNDPAKRVVIAIVTPVYNEREVLPELFARLTALFDSKTDYSWRAVLVDDGSRDDTVRLIAEQTVRDSRFELVELSRNFGFQSALTAGLAHAREVDAIVTMDADLQDPPELIPELVAAWKNGSEIVRATRRSRAETGLRRAGLDLFHAVFGRLSDFPIEPNTGTFGLLGHHAIEAFHRLPERHRFFPGLRAWIGFETTDVLYDRQDRAAGQPQQTLQKLIRYAADGLFSFSYLPLRLLTYIGVLVSTLGFALGVFFIIKRLVDIERAPMGFTTLVTVVTFLGGVQLIGIGVIGQYLARVYDEVKSRPLYIVKPQTKARPENAEARRS